VRYLLRAFVALIHIVTLGRLKYSRPGEGNALTMGVADMLWWGYKFYGHPAHEPEKGTRIREYLRAHSVTGFGGSTVIPCAPLPPFDEATITFAGDILPAQAMRAGCTEHFWDEVEGFLAADLCCANLESPVVGGKPLSCATQDITAPPQMNNSPQAVALFTRGGWGFNVLSTANNHALDQGVEGLLATLDVLDDLGVRHVGTARSAQERDAFPVLEVGGITVAFLSWTFGLNRQTAPQGREYLVNAVRLNVPGIDFTPLATQAQQARARGAEVVVACLHWGLEYESFPVAHQMETAQRIIRAGVDIIVGNHPHGLQPAERYTWRDSCDEEREGLILYALGDLMCELPQLALSALGALARVRLVRTSSGRVVIHSVELKPVYAYRRFDETGTCVDARVLDFTKVKKRMLVGDFASEPVLGPAHLRALRKLAPVQEDVMPLI